MRGATRIAKNRVTALIRMPLPVVAVFIVIAMGATMTSTAQPSQLTDSGFVQSGDLRIYFEQYASDSDSGPIILVHGWGADSRTNWLHAGWIDVLVEHRSVVAIDVRGHGKSDKPHALAPYSYAAMSSDVIAVMDYLEIDQADFLGYSMGSFMGAYLLGHHPQRFTSMVLGGIGDETEASAAQGEAIAAALRAKEGDASPVGYGQQVRQYAMQNPHNDLESLAYSAAKMWPEGYPLKIAGTRIDDAKFPILIVNGADDHPYVDSADEIATALPDARHVRIPDTDHLTVVADDRFKAVVVDFIANL